MSADFIRHLQILTLLLLFLLCHTISTSPPCLRSCSTHHVPYPFGFSPSCTIPLTCSTNGSIFLHNFPIRSIHSDSILIDLKAECNRPIQSVKPLFSSNYAPTSSNGLLLKNCSRPPTPCKLLSTDVKTNFELYDCGGGDGSGSGGNVSCYTEEQMETNFLSYEGMVKSGCEFLLTAISAEVETSELGVSMGVQVARIGWWIEGKCRCAADGVCVEVTSDITWRRGYRCTCREGFVGDGFLDGQGCRRENPGCSASRYLAGKCDGISRWGSLIGGIAAGILSMICGGLLFCCVRRRYGMKANRNAEKRITEATGSIRIPIHSYKEIEKATSGFSDKQLLGTGAYGTVYSGKLHNDEWVAIKRSKRTDTVGIEQVMNEIKLISSLSHPNLVRLLGCSIEKGEQILVYEYMANGTLAEQLQRTRGHGLPWVTRLNIACETAQAISYLHSHDPPIFHRDIKSSNILLDHNLKSKVSDFGLSRLGEVEISHISTAPQGTPGYLDPQYYQNFQLSDKSDVYSFGVLLVEIITGMRVVDFSRPQDEVNLAALASDRIGKGRVNEIIDPFLEPHTDPWTLQSTHKVAELAFRCITFHRDMRPTMIEVSEELEQIRITKFMESDESYFSTSNFSSLSSSSNLSDNPLSIVIKKIDIQSNRPVSRPNPMKLESPISTSDQWPMDHGSPSANSLLNNVVH